MAKPPPKRPLRGHPFSPRAAAHRGLTLRPMLAQLADDTWLLAQKTPALPADPALVETAGRLLGELRRQLRREPGVRLLPQAFASGIRLHALALGLRQLQVVLDGLAERTLPEGGADDIDAVSRLSALFMRDIVVRALEGRDVALPPDLRRHRPPPGDDAKVIPAGSGRS